MPAHAGRRDVPRTTISNPHEDNAAQSAPADAAAGLTFADLGLDPKILSAVTAAGYDTPTPIQAQAIPIVLKGGDVTGIAQTGTGKTAAFVLPMIQKLSRGRARALMPRCLILAPTRELAAQVSESFEKYGAHLKLSMALLIGGVSFKEQERQLTRGVDVLIATPGRLIDQFERGKILLNGVKTLIIDEADRMLDMGFIPDIEKICGFLPDARQTLLFSATMPPEIAGLAKRFQKTPERIEVSRPTETASTVTQYVVHLDSDDARARRDALRKLLDIAKPKNAIIFCNRKRDADTVTKTLLQHGYDAAAIHGDLPQAYRTQTLDRFRDGELSLLVASDVAARGLDIPEVTHVFNLAPPPKDEDYIHRIGRTGRAGREGESYTLVAPDDEKSWGFVVKMIGKEPENFSLDGASDAKPASARKRSRSSGSESPSEETDTGKTRRSRSRSRSRDRTADKDQPSAEAEEKSTDTEAKPETKSEPGSESRSSRSGSRSGSRSRSRRGQSGSDSGNDNRDNRSRAPRKRKDDDPILSPAPEDVTGFGEDVPGFMR